MMTDTLLMIRPVLFSYNEETAVDNHYQHQNQGVSSEFIQKQALFEFDTFVDKLRSEDINIQVFEDTHDPLTPDSIFPNNWISFHNTTMVLYPMFAHNRRLERRQDIIRHYVSKGLSVLDLTRYEKNNWFLEGTGSMVLDRAHNIAYASFSQRTHPEVFRVFCQKMGYIPVSFHAFQSVHGALKPIYHTNVMMCITQPISIICLDVIKDEVERQRVLASFSKTGKSVLNITEDQLNAFAGNMLEVKNKHGEPYIVMSEQAYKSLDFEQIRFLKSHFKILYSDLQTIEKYGGGSARCMMCEVFTQ